jgi:hypothetical protein
LLVCRGCSRIISQGPRLVDELLDPAVSRTAQKYLPSS